MELYSIDGDRLIALSIIELSKQRMARTCNKHVKPKTFGEGDLV